MDQLAQTERKELPACPVETTLMLIGDKWKVLILRDLLTGTKRFGELKKSVGHVTQKVLTAQLRQMEQSGLVNRKVYAEVPPRVEYTLTELGYSLKPILDAMWSWVRGISSSTERRSRRENQKTDDPDAADRRL
ncbi:MAG: helix-turn-helix domain-containing protein [Oscillospiraceae bacterium]|nr:helix-turn-helix domain-containing protein [Oscillospiraceae bacterium]